MLARWISYFWPQPLRHVGMFKSADDDCRLCYGTGWLANYEDRCMSSCQCVDASETVLGND